MFVKKIFGQFAMKIKSLNLQLRIAKLLKADMETKADDFILYLKLTENAPEHIQNQ